MSKVQKTLKILRNLDRSQIFGALFLGTIILLSSINLIRDLRSYGLKPFGFVESAFAQIFPQDTVIAAIPKAGDIPPSLCGDKIDLLQYMMAEGGAGYNLKYCTQDGPGASLQNLSLENTTFQGHPAFKLHKGNDYELYFYDDQNIYFVEDTSWDGKCQDGQRAYYRVFDNSGTLGGKIPRCWSPGQEAESKQSIKTYYRDSDNPSAKLCDANEPFQTTNPTYKLDYASQGGNGPQVPELYSNNGTVVLRNTAGAGAGEEKYYSKGYGLTGFYFKDDKVTFNSSIQTDEVDPKLICDGSTTPTTSSDPFKSPKDDIVDTPDRCIAYNDRTGKQLRSINAGGGTSLETGKGGINQGDLGQWNDNIGFVQGNNSLKRDLKMGNILSLFTDRNPGPAIDFIKSANDAGMLPVVRLCYVGGCAFSMYDNSIPDFYKAVSEAVGPDYVFVAILGPNEPGTGGEMTAFGVNDGDYGTLIAKANEAAILLQGNRVKVGGNMYLTPAAFNINNRSVNGDDVKEYLLNGRGLDLNLFDYLTGNTYNDGNATAYDNYVNSGMKKVVDDNGLKTMITEFGRFNNSDSDLKASFMKFCDDSNVDGVLFFRSFEDGERKAGQPKPLPIPISVIYDATSSCARPRNWVDCNFDSTLYADNPSKPASSVNSKASSVYSKSEDKTGDATFKVSCFGNNCDYKVTQTMRVRAPIKQFGSNSSFGTETKNYVPICANVSSFMNSTQYEPLNQYAGELGSGYAMPWLGSAINCSTELIKSSDEYAGGDGVTKMYSSPGSAYLASTADIQADIDRQVVARQYDGSTCLQVIKEGKPYIPDERTVYYKGQIMDKCPVDTSKIIRYYNPFSTPQEYKSVPEANTALKYLKNPDDYIYGPEVVLSSKTVNVGDFSQMCSQYAERNVNPDIRYVANDLDCEVKNEYAETPSGLRSCQFFAIGCTTDEAKNGTCQLNKNYDSGTLDALRNNCFEYSPKGTDQIYYKDNSFADLPKLDIPDIYDSLFTLYQRFNNILKNRDMKLVVNNNIGWNVEGYSMLRDGNTKKEGTSSLFSPTEGEKTYHLDPEVKTDLTASVTQPNIFDNSMSLARGAGNSSVKKTDYYYDWLGYLDLFQEYYSVYQNNTGLSGEQRIPNPFFNQAGAPNNNQRLLLITGRSSQYVSLPLLSCDQRNIGNSFTNSQLKGNAAFRLAIQGYLGTSSDDAINRLIDEIWPYDYTISNKDATCIEDESDTRLSNKLETEFCKRGYVVEGACGNKCTPTTEIPKPISSPVQNPGTPTTPTIPGSNFIYPTSNTVIVSGYGCSQSRPGGDCHTGVDFGRPLIEGSPIIASDAGKVVVAGGDHENPLTKNADGTNKYFDCYGQPSGSYGCYVKILHDNGITTLYAHMSAVDVTPGQIVTKGQLIGKVGATGYAGGAHLHFEIRLKDCYDGDAGDLGRCTADPVKYLSVGASETYVAACQPQDYTVTPWKGKCNEWNCGSAGSFQESLSCMTGIGYFHKNMDEWVDRYGPFCDNETYQSKVLPFGHNFTEFYDKYLPVGSGAGRSCGDIPPADRRPADVGMACLGYEARKGSEQYTYYRGALAKCSMSVDQTYWTNENSFGKSPEELADYLMNTLDVTYSGFHLSKTPREKVINVLQMAKAKNMNPFIVLGIWGTESWFGQYNLQCNISQ
ncbi:MAG: M23 family metallopeptidase [Candidatus Dojkabacteria bacterium]